MPGENDKCGTLDGSGGKSCGSSIGTAVMGAMIIFSVYLWICYQPEMNARYKTRHCDGALSSGDVVPMEGL